MLSFTEVSLQGAEKLIAFLNPLNAKLNPICHLLALLGAHYIFHVSGVRVNGGIWCSFKNNFCLTTVCELRRLCSMDDFEWRIGRMLKEAFVECLRSYLEELRRTSVIVAGSWM